MRQIAIRSSITFYAICLLAISGSATADDSSSGDSRWVPSIAVTLGFTSQKFEGAFEDSNLVVGPFTLPLRDRKAKDGQNFMNSLNVGGQFEIMSPAIPIPFVRPRIFFGGEVEHISSQRRQIAVETDPKTFQTDPARPGFSSVGISGQGTAVAVDTDPAQFGARIGISFPVTIGDWQVSIKPSARYLNQKLLYTGIMSHATQTGQLDDMGPTTRVLVQGSASQDVHAIGPGLEIEVAAGGVRSLAAAVFIGGGAYKVLSDRDVSFTGSGGNNFFGTSEPGNSFIYNSFWSARAAPWIYRFEVGVRVKWLGSKQGWLFGALGN